MFATLIMFWQSVLYFKNINQYLKLPLARNAYWQRTMFLWQARRRRADAFRGVICRSTVASYWMPIPQVVIACYCWPGWWLCLRYWSMPFRKGSVFVRSRSCRKLHRCASISSGLCFVCTYTSYSVHSFLSLAVLFVSKGAFVRTPFNSRGFLAWVYFVASFV